MRDMKSHHLIVAGLFVLVGLLLSSGLLAQAQLDRCLVPAPIRDAILNEVSGERAYLHVQMLAGNRDRQAEEYQNLYFETTYMRDMARQAGMSDVQVDLFPSSDMWDAEEGDLWMVQPAKKKLASITMVPTALARGSKNADVEAEVVYVGQAREADYAGKDVKGKIVFGNTSVSTVFTSGVLQHGAAGALGTGSSGVSGNSAGYTLDQIGWAAVSPGNRDGFGFALSLRQATELRDLVERGQKVVLRAHVRARMYPAKMNVVSASIPGTDPNAGELILVAHAFETTATPGANDNCTGVGTVLEVGRTLARLIKDGTLPPPRRTIRFILGPEISGSTAYIVKHPELQDRLLAALNFDMTGANVETTDSYLRMKMTPDSRPSYLNDLLASLLRFVDQNDVRTQQGDNGQFNYRLVPVAAVTSGSDHSVFNNGGIPAMQFNYWPDNFYHSSEDRIIYVNPTELKRVGFMAASAMYYLANAGAAEARDLAWETAINGQAWVAEVSRQSVRLLGRDGQKLYDQHKAVQMKVAGAFGRARGGVESVLTLSKEPEVAATVKTLVGTLEGVRDLNTRMLETVYRERAAALGVKPLPVTLTEQEREYSTMIPRRLFKAYSQEAQKRAEQSRGAQGAAPGAQPGGAAPPPRRLPGLASAEVANFIDGKRSILDIYQAVRAECGQAVLGSAEQKYAYVLSPDAADVELDLVVSALQTLEKDGVIEIVKVEPKPADAKKNGAKK